MMVEVILIAGCGKRLFALPGELLSFASSKESNQRKDDPIASTESKALGSLRCSIRLGAC